MYLHPLVLLTMFVYVYINRNYKPISSVCGCDTHVLLILSTVKAELECVAIKKS